MLVPKDVHRLEASACSVRAFSLWELDRAAVLGAGPVSLGLKPQRFPWQTVGKPRVGLKEEEDVLL